MSNLTKKQLNKIKAVAFEEFKNQYTGEEFKSIFSDVDIVSGWRIEEGTRSKLFLTQHDTQVNKNTLSEMGFTENAKVEKLFFANRKTKTLEFVGRC